MHLKYLEKKTRFDYFEWCCGSRSFFWLGKLFGAKTVYIEIFDRIDKPTLTGKLVYPVTDKFIVQWEELKKVYPKAINLGGIF